MPSHHQHHRTSVIRPMDESDLDQIVALSLLAWRPVFDSFEKVLGRVIFDRLYRPDWRTAQAEAVRATCAADGADPYVVLTSAGGEVAGFVVLARDPDESLGVVEMIAVHPKHQRSGHGRHLMSHAVKVFSADGLALMNVGTGGDPGHAPARALYESMGFTGVPLVNYYRALA
ncbi:MAG: GNAT family N-acetyltransferase [Nocardioides sp.]|nr:GNAT family N-acetyltransferase [Nocardioides sp.]